MKARKTRVSPTKMALDYLRKRGVACEVVEKWVKIAGGGFRRDCFGFDILGLTNTDTIGIQAGIGAHHAEKIAKATNEPKVRLWLGSPYRIFWVMTFTQRVAFNKGGAKAKRPKWTPRVTQLTLRGGKIVAERFELRQES